VSERLHFMTRTIGPSLEKISRVRVKQGRRKTTGRRTDYALLQRRVMDPIAREFEGNTEAARGPVHGPEVAATSARW